MQPAAAQRLPADSPQAPLMATGPSLRLSLGLYTLECLQAWTASPVPCSSSKPLLQRPQSPTELWSQDRLAERLGWADPCTGRGLPGSSRLRASLRRSGSAPPHVSLHRQAPSTRQGSAQACRACCSNTCSLSQTPALPLHRCPRLPASPTVRPACQVACQIRPWCQHSSSKPLPQQRMHGMHRLGVRDAQALSSHHTTTSEPIHLVYNQKVLISSPGISRMLHQMCHEVLPHRSHVLAPGGTHCARPSLEFVPLPGVL